MAQAVDTSILKAGLLAASMAVVKSDGEPLPRPHLDRMQLGLSALYRLYEAADGWLCLAAMTEVQWLSLFRALELENLASDTRFADADARALNRSALEAVLVPRFEARPVKEVFDLLDGLGVPCRCRGEFVLESSMTPRCNLRNSWYTNNTRNWVTSTISGERSTSPRRRAASGGRRLCAANTRGEIMREYGYDDADIDKLVGVKAIFEELRVD